MGTEHNSNEGDKVKKTELKAILYVRIKPVIYEAISLEAEERGCSMGRVVEDAFKVRMEAANDR